jgi:membrane protease YdiL (CAAX protease family)
LLLVGGLAAAAAHIVSLERDELEHESAWHTLDELRQRPEATRISARLTEVALKEGEHALFEVCARDTLAEQTWNGALTFMVWEPQTQKAELKVPLEPAYLATVKRNAQGACLTLGGGRIARSGKYALEAVWTPEAQPAERILSTPLKARVLGRRLLGVREGLLVWCLALGALLSVFAGFSPGGEPVSPPRRAVAWALAGSALLALWTWGAVHLPLPGSVGGFARGLLLSLFQVAVAAGFARALYTLPRAGLGLRAPARRAGLWLFGAMAAALLLKPVGRWIMAVVPASGEAPIEAFISWPSGALAFAALGMAVPLAEELFFRGFLYGALRPLGTVPACACTIVLFTALHAQQTWGNWGALLSISLTGCVLTLLRAWSGSTLVPAVTHLLFNLSLWANSFQS